MAVTAANYWVLNSEVLRGVFRRVEQVKTISDLKEEYAGTFWGDKALALMEQRPGRRVKADLGDGGFWRKYRPY